MQKTITLVLMADLITATPRSLAADSEEGFHPLFNGKDLSG
jgi:hypothetical protein